MKRRTSPTVSRLAGRANKYPPSAPRRDSTKPACLRLARINSRNFCGIFCRPAISAIRTGSPARWEARSKIACNAYSPLTEMFIGAGRWNHLYPTRDCRAWRPRGANRREGLPILSSLAVRGCDVARLGAGSRISGARQAQIEQQRNHRGPLSAHGKSAVHHRQRQPRVRETLQPAEHQKRSSEVQNHDWQQHEKNTPAMALAQIAAALEYFAFAIALNGDNDIGKNQ